MLFMLSTCFLWLSASGPQMAHAEGNASRDYRLLAPNNADFAFKLYKHLMASAPSENVFISPISVSMAISMLSLGAQDQTRTQMLQGLGFNISEITESKIHEFFQNLLDLLTKSTSDLDLVMGNALFLNDSLEIEKPFLGQAQNYYALETVAADFQDWDSANKQFHEFIKNRTRGKISDFFLEPEDSMPLIMVNYIFFKGTWVHAFDPNRTREEDFHVNKTVTVRVPMMVKSGLIKYLWDQELHCHVVQLECDRNGTLFFILPEEGKLDTIMAALSRDTIQRWSLSLNKVQMELSIPKFSISGVHDLWEIMSDLNLLDDQADFSGIAPKDQMKKPKVLHKVVLQIDEEGTKPAPPMQTLKSTDSAPMKINFNHPFIILQFDHITWSTKFLKFVTKPM